MGLGNSAIREVLCLPGMGLPSFLYSTEKCDLGADDMMDFKAQYLWPLVSYVHCSCGREECKKLIPVASTSHYEVMETYANYRYLLGGYKVNSLPGRTLDMYFHGKQPTEIVKHKKLTTRLLVRDTLKLSGPGLYVQQIHAVICFLFHCAGLCFYWHSIRKVFPTLARVLPYR